MANLRAFSTASRKEIDLEPQLVEGSFPTDLQGVVFLNTAAGTVNGDGLPYPEKYPDGTAVQEFGSPLINGDGMMYRFDFTVPGKLRVKTGLFKPPCYYADLATRKVPGMPAGPYADLAFQNMGLARISMKLGTRNELNTAITPIKLPGEDKVRMLATFDAGRPFEFDPAGLQLLTAIGRNSHWAAGLPPILDQPLGMVLTTAHPVFDPETHELFSVNFTKDDAMLMMSTTLMAAMIHDLEWLEREFLKWIGDSKGLPPHEVRKKFITLIKRVHRQAPSKNQNWWQILVNNVLALVDKVYFKLFSNKNAVKLIRWTGKQDVEEWTVVDEKGEPLVIEHNMHQIGISRDYVILGDTNFKFTLDVMLNYPFPKNDVIDAFLRGLLSGPMNDYSTIYLVPRADLKPGGGQVKATSVRLNVETVHFSADYENPDGKVTIHTAHNCAACPAEWLRRYDHQATDPLKAVDPQKLGLIAVGEMDIGKIGRVVVDAKTGSIDTERTKFLHTPEPGVPAGNGPHTWGVGLYTYRDMLSPVHNVAKVEHIYWQSYGLREDMLTRFIYDMYGVPSRPHVYSPEQMLEATRGGAPFNLFCVETEGLTIVDHFSFPMNMYMWSLQFIPRQGGSAGVPASRDGYILCTVIVGEQHSEGIDYRPQLWLFDAARLSAGPVCKLAHPDLSFGFTIHSVWVHAAESVPPPAYALDVQSDYDERIAVVRNAELRARIQQLFNDEVYPHFPKKA